MKNDWNILQILRHSRHDWLNVIQLIKGNLTLKKYDRIEEIIQEVINQTQNESKLSNLQLTQFASEIFVFNWENDHFFQIEFEVVGENVSLKEYEKSLLNWFHRFVYVLDNSCEQYGDNHLLLTIELLESSPRFTFDFRGKLLKGDNLCEFINNDSTWNEQLHLVEYTINEDEFYVTFRLVA